MLKNRIICFCYFYLVGIVIAKLLPVDSSWLTLIRIITAVLFIGLAGYHIYRHFEKKAGYKYEMMSTRVLGWVLLLLAAMAFGHGRYTESNMVPDNRMGSITFGDSEPLKIDVQPDDTCRVRIRKTQPLDADVRLKIQGELKARMPILSEDGLPQMDSKGRWRFWIKEQNYATGEIVIPKDDPVGTDYPLEEPFNRLTGVEVLEGPSSGSLTIYRISNHLASFVRLGMNSMPVTFLGKVSGDPWVYDFKTVLNLTPTYIQYRPNGPYFKVEGGNIRANLDAKVDDYRHFARSEGYGLDVMVTAPLFEARPQANPGDFDQRNYLRNNNIYGQMSLRQARGGSAPIVAIAPEGKGFSKGHPLVRISLKIRDDMLRVLKQTLPYPQSAMVAAVTLGLRYGLANVPCVFSPEHGKSFMHQNCELTIPQEFQYTGVGHVLAVSGLHVTIITILFMGIFALLRLSKRVYVPFIVLALVIFAIITGARPSTLRAVIMNSLFLLTWGYLNQGLVASALIGLPVAAFLILIYNPMMVVDPSFTLSFGAILALVLISPPCFKLLSLLRGNTLLAAIIMIALPTFALTASWFLYTSLRFWVPFLILCVLMCYAVRELNRRKIKLFGDLAFARIPVAISGLLASQFAIMWGMMAPLSAVYFCRWGSGGSFANLIALPLIGVVVQLGVLAGLIGQIPVIGPFLALLMNAANFVAATGFCWLAHFFAKPFPYALVRKISPTHLLFYYLLMAVFVWHEPIWRWMKDQLTRKSWRKVWGYSAIAVLVLLLAGAVATGPYYKHGDNLDITMLAVNYGSAMLVETPGDKKFLIDAGMVEHERGRFNSAERTVMPFCSFKHITSLDGLIVMSPHLERAAGAGYILKYMGVDTLYLPPSLAGVTPDMTPDEFYAKILAGSPSAEYDPVFLQAVYDDIIGSETFTRQVSLARAIRNAGPSFVNNWSGNVVKQKEVRAGDVIYEETHNGKRFAIEALSPLPDTPAGDFPMENGSMVLRISYGDFAVIVGGDLHFDGQKHLADTCPPEKLAAQVLVAPHHGTAAPVSGSGDAKQAMLDELDRATAPLLAKIKPEKVLFDYGNPGSVYKARTKEARAAHELTFRFMEDKVGEGNVKSTERDMALFVSSDGTGYTLETQAQKVSFGGEDAEAVSSIEVGF
ncbi:MAG: ComEC/Rec2 family competence protein [Kiritimatiellia bacterium]